MTYQQRQAARRNLIGILLTAFKAVAILYLAAHFAVVWRAFESEGLLAAIATLVTLGFGDVYWAVRWFGEDYRNMAWVASSAAALCFASWLTRPFFNRWALNFTLEMVKDLTDEIDDVMSELQDKSGDDIGNSIGDDNGRKS